MLVGVVAGLLSFGFLKVYGEPQVDRAVEYETQQAEAKATRANKADGHVHAPATKTEVHVHRSDEDEPELVSRSVQAGLGLFVAALVYSTAVGGLFGLAYAFAYGRVPGAFKPQESAPVNGAIVDKSAEVGALRAKRRYLETVVAEAGDVDITKHAILVSIGRGIQEKDNVSIAQELADVMGGAVSCSRPVVDAKWLEKSRQVGSSGKTVKPKVYMACGMSGSFQHLAGLKGNPFIIAINKNPKAPIFQVADVGIVDDILEFLPELTNKIRERHGVSAN